MTSKAISWQSVHFERLIARLSEWREEDHADVIALSRSEIIQILEGVKALRSHYAE